MISRAYSGTYLGAVRPRRGHCPLHPLYLTNLHIAIARENCRFQALLGNERPEALPPLP